MKNIILDFSKEIKDIIVTEDTNIFGLFLGTDNISSRNSPKIIIKTAGISLNLYVKAVMDGKSIFEFSPALEVATGLSGITANLKIKVLNISEDTFIKSTPAMEIEEPDISASHSLSISNFDNKQLVYLTSRGLSEIQAKKVLINSFIADISSNL
jgi:Fe-S cluster assembly scaffold protein SufB